MMQLRSGKHSSWTSPASPTETSRPWKVPRTRAFKACACGERGAFTKLPAETLGKLWPVERLVHGLLVAKWLKDDLHKHAALIVLSSSTDCWKCGVDGEVFSVSLQRWQNKGASMGLFFDEKFFLPREASRRLPSAFGGLLEAIAAPGGIGNMLSHLDLSFCDLRDAGVIVLAGIIHQCRALKWLSLNGNSIHDDSAFELAHGLGFCTALSVLDLGSNCLHEWTGLLALFLEHCKALQRLNICSWRECQSSTEFWPLSFEVLAHLCTLPISNDRRSIIALNASRYVPDDVNNPFLDMNLQDCEKLASALGRCPRLRCLDLSMNSCDDPGLPIICSGIDMSIITHLDLSENILSDVGVQYLAEATEQVQYGNTGASLLCLRLSRNYISSTPGGGAIARILRSCRELIELDLSENELKDDGIAALAQGLSSSCGTKLKRMNVSGNGFRASGTAALAAGLRNFCTGLETLDVNDNSMGNAGAESMAKIVQRCKKLRTLGIAWTAMSALGIRRLALAFTKRRKVCFIVGGLFTKVDRAFIDQIRSERCVLQWQDW